MKDTTMKTSELKAVFMNVTPNNWVRSKWGKEVQIYALELLNYLEENHEITCKETLKTQLLNIEE